MSEEKELQIDIEINVDNAEVVSESKFKKDLDKVILTDKQKLEDSEK